MLPDYLMNMTIRDSTDTITGTQPTLQHPVPGKKLDIQAVSGAQDLEDVSSEEEDQENPEDEEDEEEEPETPSNPDKRITLPRGNPQEGGAPPPPPPPPGNPRNNPDGSEPDSNPEEESGEDKMTRLIFRNMQTTQAGLVRLLNEQQRQSGTTDKLIEAIGKQTPSASKSTQVLKVGLPEHFSGKRSKLKEFISQCQLYIEFNPKLFKTDRKKILFYASYFRDEAFNWFEPHLRNLLSITGKGKIDPILDDYVGFLKLLHDTFGALDEVQVAERKITLLRQTTTATLYATEFRQHASHLAWGEAALVYQFYKGLKSEVQDEISRLGRPESLNEMIELAVTIDNRLFERRIEKNTGTTKAPYHSNPRDNRSVQNSPYQTPRPYDKNVSATFNSPKRGPLSAKDRAYRMENNLCLYCGKGGHSVRDCRLAKQSPTHRITPVRQAASTTKKPDTSTSKKTTMKAAEHSKLSWTACSTNSCLAHLSDKQGSGYFPKKEKKQQYPLQDPRNYYHDQAGWRACTVDTCESHLESKQKNYFPYGSFSGKEYTSWLQADYEG